LLDRERQEGNDMRTSATLGALVLVVMAAVSATAGVIDSPLPNLQSGQITRHVFTVPGVMKNNNLETEFVCTSLETTLSVRIGVEIFGAAGGSPLNNVNEGFGDGAQDIGPGGTLTIGTGNTLGIHEDEVITPTALPAGSVKNGSARILATSTKIVCNAFLTDDTSDPPVSMVPLKTIAKRRQNGD
jgi:hypothetical protein